MKKHLLAYLIIALWLFVTSTIVYATTSNYNLQILKVNTENFPEVIFVEFTVTDSNGNFVEGLTKDDFVIKDNGTFKYGCKRLIHDLTELLLPIDIVFLVDNSGSMSDEQDKIRNAIPKLLEGLKDKGDVRVALCRFGQSDYTSYINNNIWGTIEKTSSGFAFSPLRNTLDINLFVSNIWSRNKENGGYEPYYNVLHWAALQDFGYRPNALKIFILLGDEDYLYSNSYNSPLDEPTVAETLSQYGIQTFVIQTPSYRNEYEQITTQTGGTFLDVTSSSYDPLLEHITNKIKGRYILRYCLETDSVYDVCKDIRNSNISYNDKTAYRPYRPIKSATLTRTESTQLLDEMSIDAHKPVDLSVLVTENGNQIDSVSLYYRSSLSSTFKKITTHDYFRQPNGQLLYTFSIPTSDVVGASIYYYFEAETSITFNQIKSDAKVTSPAYTHNLFTWNIAINPNKVPIISQVKHEIALPCRSLAFYATITGDDITAVKLNYRIANISSEFREVTMYAQAGSNRYEASLPAETSADIAIEYFVVATNQQGLQAHYGSSSAPILLNIDTQSTLSKQGPMEIVIHGLDRITIGCNPISKQDSIAAYYSMSCGGAVQDVLGAVAHWDKLLGGFRLVVYGNTSNYITKNGFDVGEPLKLKLIQNGIDYVLENHHIVYSPNARITNFPHIAIGPQEPIATFMQGTNIINNGAVIDFDACEKTTTQKVVLKNTGCEMLYIKDMSINNPLFTVAPLRVDSLLPGEQTELVLSYQPDMDAHATLEVHTNVPSRHYYNFYLTGKSLVVSPCATMQMQPTNPQLGDSLTFTYDLRTQNDVEVLLKPSCSNVVDWSHTFNGVIGPQKLSINKTLPTGKYKLSFYTKEDLCEYLFEITQ